MSLNYQPFIIGSLQNNCYLIYDARTKAATVIDPPEAVGQVVTFIQKNQLSVDKVLVTHAHFDHILGCRALRDEFPSAKIFLHPDDRNLWSKKGNAERFGFAAPDLPQPDHWLRHEEIILLGSGLLQVRHTPGHTPGHVVFYAQSLGCVFCGDLIFRRSVGRTDLPGGDFTQLKQSIETQIFSLPDETLLNSGHGPSTTVGEEKMGNPYV